MIRRGELNVRGERERERRGAEVGGRDGDHKMYRQSKECTLIAIVRL